MDFFNRLKELINNYIKSPGNKVLNKSLKDIYAEMSLEEVKDIDIEENIDRDSMIQNFVKDKDNVQPKFEVLDIVSSIKLPY